MMGPIHSYIFFQDQVMLISVILSIKLNQAKNSFCLISSAASPTFKVVIKEAILFIRRVKLASSIILDHAAAPNTPAPSTTFTESIAKCCLFHGDSAV